MDGTLVDTTDGIIASLQRLQQELQLKQLPPQTLRRFIGPPLKTSLMKYYGVSLAQTEELTRAYRECYMQVGVERTKIFPYTREILYAIRAAGAKAAIVTLKQHQLATLTLRHTKIDTLVDYICLNLDNSVGDKAKMIRQALAAVDCETPSQALMIGDSPFDGSAAEEAGVDFLPLAFGEGFRNPAALKGVTHVAVAETTAQLPEIIRQLLTGG